MLTLLGTVIRTIQKERKTEKSAIRRIFRRLIWTAF